MIYIPIGTPLLKTRPKILKLIRDNLVNATMVTMGTSNTVNINWSHHILILY